MDWNLAIERNREALKRIVATLVAMAGLASSSSPPAGEDGSARRVEADALAEPGEEVRAPTLPRHLHRAILRLLRPAESAVRRLIIVMARGVVVTLPPSRLRKARPRLTVHSKPGTGILISSESSIRPAARTPTLPLLDPFKSLRRRRPVHGGIPRISLPGFSTPFPVAPPCPPGPDDLLDARRLVLRLQALGSALDDLPRHAHRFARWRAARAAGRARRTWPLRPGRPPGQRPANKRTHEVHELLNDIHGLAFDVLEHHDTS